MERRIIHLDMDAFYASVEMLDNPEFKGKPVIVGGGSQRGVVSAASYEARKYGVHSALAIAIAHKRCPHGVFVRPRMARYREISSHIMAIFRRFTPLVEPLSLDEAFLDVTSSERLFGPAEFIAKTIRLLVKNETGLTVSAGVAGCKLVAKIASDYEKPDGLTIVGVGKDREFLAPLPIDLMWGVGKAGLKELRKLGVRSIEDLIKFPMDFLLKKFGKQGIHFYNASRAEDNRPVEPEREAKSIGHENTFDKDMLSLVEIHKELLGLSVRVAKRLRDHQLTARTLTVKTKYYDFVQTTRSKTLQDVTDDSAVLYKEGLKLLQETQVGRKPLRLLGLTCANLVNSWQPRQIDLFGSENELQERKRLNQAVDKITEKFGNSSILPGSLVKE